MKGPSRVSMEVVQQESILCDQMSLIECAASRDNPINILEEAWRKKIVIRFEGSYPKDLMSGSI